MTDMQKYVIEIKRMLLHIIIWATGVCVSIYFAGFGWLIPGLLLGIVTSVFYFLLTCYRVGKSVDMPVNKAIAYMRVGWLCRLLFIILMLVLSLRIPNINFWSAVIGMFFVQMVMLFKTIFVIIQRYFGCGKTGYTDACL